MPHDARVDELLKELLDSGATPEEVCRGCPELLAPVRAGWHKLGVLQAQVGALFPESPSVDRANSNVTRPHVAEASLPGRLAESELKANASEFWSLTEQAALHYRAGRFPQAVALFEQSLRADPTAGKAVLNWLWLALAQQRLGKPEEARRWLDKAAAWLDQYRGGLPARAEEELGLHLHNWLEAHVLRREAEPLIRPADAR